MLARFFTDLFTTADGVSWDVGRVLWALAVCWFLGLSTYAVVGNAQPFDPISWGTGLAAVLAAGGAALWAKKDTEPPPDPTIPQIER
ncbi:MAG: amino acid ABC transporter substrate-binding protein [Armatimonadetes bacterium]|nr:amino acid ABC transporter substrate-binding protein [Armatimonadota bacterium]